MSTPQPLPEQTAAQKASPGCAAGRWTPYGGGTKPSPGGLVRSRKVSGVVRPTRAANLVETTGRLPELAELDRRPRERAALTLSLLVVSLTVFAYISCGANLRG